MAPYCIDIAFILSYSLITNSSYSLFALSCSSICLSLSILSSSSSASKSSFSSFYCVVSMLCGPSYDSSR